MVLKKTLESPLDCKEIQPVHPKGNQSWVFIGSTDAEAETPILWPPDAKNWLIWKDPDAGKDWGQEEKGMTEDEMAGWHHRLDGPESQWTPGVGDGQGGLACCDSWGRKESDTTEWLNWPELNMNNEKWPYVYAARTGQVLVSWFISVAMNSTAGNKADPFSTYRLGKRIDDFRNLNFPYSSLLPLFLTTSE